MPDSFIGLPTDGTGKKLRTSDKGASGHDQYVIPTTPRIVSFCGRAATFRTPGRGGTTGHRLFVIYNAVGSAVLVAVSRIAIDVAGTAAKAVTVLPPTIRLHRLTAAPTGGTAVPKVPFDTTQASNASVTTTGDASADGTSTTVGLTVVIPAGNILSQEYASRLITAAGYEPADRIHMLEDSPDVILRAGQGLAVELVYAAATQNPTTDMWTVTATFEEFTL